MAPIARRTWDEMRDEFLLRMGKPNVTAWQPRAEHFLTAAYYDLALLFHHYELDVELSLLLASGAKQLSFGASSPQVYSILAVRANEAGLRTPISQEHRKFNFQEVAAQAKPKKWARQEQVLYFDRASDRDLDIEILAYRYPAAPDFDPGASESELSWIWDEHILQRAMFLSAPATWRYDMSQVQLQTLQSFIEAQPQQPTKSNLVARAELPLSSQSQGGQQ